MGNEDKLPTAAEMRGRLQEAQGMAAQAQVMELVTKITSAVERGQSSVRVTKFEPGVRQLIERRGYKVTHYAPDQRDPVDTPSYYTVSW